MADVSIPNMVVTFGNGAEVIYVVNQTAYRAASKFDHPVLTKAVVELSGGIWTEKIADDWLKQIPPVDYFQAIDQICATGKSLKEAVEFLSLKSSDTDTDEGSNS